MNRQGVQSLPCESRGPAGFSLLEVLVSVGILVTGLASVAALLPASGALLREATTLDRSVALVANAHADLRSRNALSSSLFTSVPAGRAVVFGEVLRSATSTAVVPANAAALNILMNADDFFLPDDVAYGASVSGTTPANSFVNGGTAVREFKPGVCYGAMLTPVDFAAAIASGSSATLSVAIFAKSNATFTTLDLIPVVASASTFRVPGASASAAETNRKSFLRGCGWVLALPPTAAQSPRWFRIASSWTTDVINAITGAVEPADSFVTFEDATVKDVPLTSGALRVVGFERLMTVDEKIVVLE